MKDENKKLYGYKRTLHDETIIMIINNSSEKAEIQLEYDHKLRLIDLLTGENYRSYNGKVMLRMKPKTGLLLLESSMLMTTEKKKMTDRLAIT